MRKPRVRPQRVKQQMLMAVATFVVQWSPDMPADDVLIGWLLAAVAGIPAASRLDVDEIHVERNSVVTELRCLAMYGPVPATAATLGRQFEQQLATVCVWLGGTSFAAFKAEYRGWRD
jgi:hypothetical protein